MSSYPRMTSVFNKPTIIFRLTLLSKKRKTSLPTITTPSMLAVPVWKK